MEQGPSSRSEVVPPHNENPKFKNLIVLIEGKPFFVNKKMLSRRSPILAELIDAMEPNQDTITLTDVDPSKFQNFLDFIHERRLSYNEGEFMDILEVAEKFSAFSTYNNCQHLVVISREIYPVDKLEIAIKFKFEDPLKCAIVDNFRSVYQLELVMSSEIILQDVYLMGLLFNRAISIRHSPTRFMGCNSLNSLNS
ncbi:hypothetical protein CRE_14608 [Caenorhabditis remanei]|uniref:BTB domain-containing protein n=1 Tax=Caenorhabditis remanei TaxID=31234 RepID=E3M925_CAERE|nr:hypothetical protein CRE_14608 [Caenorhabditis remanei]